MIHDVSHTESPKVVDPSIEKRRLLRYIDGFISETDPEYQRGLISRVERMSQHESILTAGEMCLELARRTPSNADELLTRANYHFNNVIAKQSTRFPVPQSEGLRAMRMQNMMPVFFSLFVHQELPTPMWQTKVYEKSLEAAEVAAQSKIYYRSIPNMRIEASRVTGETAEHAVGLLGLRFGILQGDASWIMSPSMLSEDRSPKSQPVRQARNSWDYSVFTESQGHHEPVYKLQVKNDARSEATEHYSDEITLLYLRQDLAVEHEEYTTSDRIISECILERSEPYFKSLEARLDERVDLLLDKLG